MTFFRKCKFIQYRCELQYFKSNTGTQTGIQMINTHQFPKLFILIGLLACFCLQRCVYKVHEDGRPELVDDEPHLIQGLTQCVQYNGKMGCCNQFNDAGQVVSYREIDGIFGSQGGGCDVCGINLKRFWCQYACSPRQNEFMEGSKQLYPYPDPKDPSKTVMVQRINLTVHADSACSLYSSCKRIGFVTSVSAMSTPAGFLTFQGHNAVDDAYQYINVNFSYSTKNSLYFNDDKKDTEPERAAFQACNFTAPKGKVHGFNFTENCTCNNCEDSCDSSTGFIYSDPSVLYGFNWILVSSVWGVSLLIIGLVTYYRQRIQKQKTQ